jgi:hypothetical protein
VRKNKYLDNEELIIREKVGIKLSYKPISMLANGKGE